MTKEQLGQTVLDALDEMNDERLSPIGRQTLAGFAERKLAHVHRAQQSEWFGNEIEKIEKSLSQFKK